MARDGPDPTLVDDPSLLPKSCLKRGTILWLKKAQDLRHVVMALTKIRDSVCDHPVVLSEDLDEASDTVRVHLVSVTVPSGSLEKLHADIL